MATRKRVVRNLIVVSDTHAGCRLGLYPSKSVVRLDDGGWYRPSEFQLQMYALWNAFWNEWVPEVTKGESFDLVHNGDVIDGVHHNSTTQVSQNIKDQKRIAVALMEPIVTRCRASGGRYYHIRGTAAHVGPSSIWEEEVAEALGAVPNSVGQHARHDLWKRVGDPDGPLVNLLHHIGTTGSAAHEASAVNAEYTAAVTDAARWGRPAPDFVVRSHRHRMIAVDIETGRGHGASIVTPGWQGKTPFVYRIPGARVSEPQFGGVLIRQGDRSNYYDRKVWSIERSREE